MDPKQRSFVRLKDAGREIQDADLLLFRRRGLISIAGRGEHSHAAKAAWWDDDLFCLEIREFKGGRAVTLESQVERFSGRIDVLAANHSDRWTEYDRPNIAIGSQRIGVKYHPRLPRSNPWMANVSQPKAPQI